jgi:serine/threonine protein kinase
MNNENADLLRLAEAVADGKPVDWESETTNHAELASRLRGLRLVESISSGHRLVESSRKPAVDETTEMDETRAGAPAAAALSAPGRRWGPLELIEKLGEGAFGEVWRAREPKLDRDVALKLRKKRPTANDPFAGRFLDEARKLAKVDHENIVEIYGADEHDGREGLWTKLAQGKTLEDELRERGPFGDREAALVGVELFRALAAVHREGLVHRDVKTSNAIRAHGGKILLMDFGSVTDIPRKGDVGEARDISGTPLAMAPEALRGVPLTPSADIYSLGVLLYRLTSGKDPVTASTVAELVAKHQRGERIPLRDRRPDLSPEFVQVVERALSPDGKDRYQSAGAMEGALQKAIGTTTSVDVPSGGQDVAPRPTPEPRRRLWWAAAAAALVVAVAGLLIWQLFPSGSFEVEASIFRESGAGEDGDVRLAAGGRVQPGDRLFVEVEGTETMYAYVINQDDTGEEYLLFPLDGFETTNPLPPGVSHRLPGVLDGVDQSWVVTSAGGTERFLLVASAEPIPILEDQVRTLAQSEPGMPIRMNPGTGLKLRGVGGVERANRKDSASGRDLTDLADDVARAGGDQPKIHVEMFELANPPGAAGRP